MSAVRSIICSADSYEYDLQSRVEWLLLAGFSLDPVMSASKSGRSVLVHQSG